MTYLPLDKLGSSPTNINFSFSLTLTLENAAVIETVNNYNVIYNNPYLTHTFLSNIFTFSGSVPLEVFDQYQMKYINKGKSDKNETPVNCSIADMPDSKELFQITPDSRISIEIPIIINLQIQKKTLGLTPEEDVTEIINEVINTKIEILNDLMFIKNWTIDYFKNRY